MDIILDIMEYLASVVARTFQVQIAVTTSFTGSTFRLVVKHRKIQES